MTRSTFHEGGPTIHTAGFFDEPRDGESAPAKGWRGYRWLIGLWVTVAVFGAVMVARSIQVDVPIRDPGGSMFLVRLGVSLMWFAALSVVDAMIRVGRANLSVGRVGAMLRRRWPKDRLALAVTGLLAYHLVYLFYRNLKSWVVFRGYHDDALLEFEKNVFFGHSPASLLHGLFGEHIGSYVIAGIYESFAYIVPLSFVAALVFAGRIRDGYVFLTAAIWAWILGTVSYYLIPSLGPFASAPDDFAGLSRTFINTKQDTLLVDRLHLLQDPSASDAFASIGAFASLHVGFTCMIVLMLRYYGFRRATQVMTVYLAATVVATLYLGYHFVIDDIAGVILAFLSVLFARWTIYPRGGRTLALTREREGTSGESGRLASLRRWVA
ncbi:phosphatase PAP2 family protein [Solicola gregarius]|uniref:Phosphatase PAP2 family protein n=1 Tax=Solicola gregarius TaxID=2908642 RepID=A0AA46TKW1_9ACTN|nr:phosphatase PAP2 family protein [Solicola gregarius]UYM07161.1 phosphatase PAP2 family protein [Solicola gregarius]